MRSNILSISNRAPRKGSTVRALKWSVIGQHRTRPHTLRKVYHLLNGVFCFALYAFLLTKTQALVVLGTLGGILVMLDILRLRFPAVRNAALSVFGKVMRREELKSLTGNSFYILGIFVITLFFPKPIVLLSVLFLAIGDPIASIVGTAYGKTKLWNQKSLEGALANFASTALVTALMGTFYFHLTAGQTLILAIVGGLVSTTAELVPLKIDDNFTIPVISAILLTVVSLFLPFF